MEFIYQKYDEQFNIHNYIISNGNKRHDIKIKDAIEVEKKLSKLLKILAFLSVNARYDVNTYGMDNITYTTPRIRIKANSKEHGYEILNKNKDVIEEFLKTIPNVTIYKTTKNISPDDIDSEMLATHNVRRSVEYEDYFNVKDIYFIFDDKIDQLLKTMIIHKYGLEPYKGTNTLAPHMMID